MNPATIDLKPANAALRAKGLEPFPVEAITITPHDDAHLQESCRQISELVTVWAMKQSRP